VRIKVFTAPGVLRHSTRRSSSRHSRRAAPGASEGAADGTVLDSSAREPGTGRRRRRGASLIVTTVPHQGVVARGQRRVIEDVRWRRPARSRSLRRPTRCGEALSITATVRTRDWAPDSDRQSDRRRRGSETP
jgi:hypothetical protein